MIQYIDKSIFGKHPAAPANTNTVTQANNVTTECPPNASVIQPTEIRLREATDTRTTMHIYDNSNLTGVSTEFKHEARAISVWVQTCSLQADKHKKKAKHLRFIHAIMVFATLSLSACASIFSGIASQSPNGTENYVSLVTSALTTAVMGIMTFVDPASKRNSHLMCELQYNILGRDMAVYLAGLGEDAVTCRDMDPKTAMYEYQRRMDNIEATAPEV